MEQEEYEKYVQEFCRRTETEFQYWLNNKVGEVAVISGQFVQFRDIEDFVDRNIPLPFNNF